MKPDFDKILLDLSYRIPSGVVDLTKRTHLNELVIILEENGVYIQGDMIKTDEKFLEMVNKLKVYYEKFKSKWAKVLASRKKTSSDD